MELLFFGSLTEITQVEKLSFDINTIDSVGIDPDQKIDTDILKKILQEKFPAIQTAKYFMAVNQQMIHQNTALKQGDIVAFMPPFSGG